MSAKFLAALAVAAVAAIGVTSASGAGGNDAGAIPARVAAPIVVAQDPTTGQASGKRTHGDFSIWVAHVDPVNRNQVETALRSELAGANFRVSQDEFVGAVDNAMRLLAGWTGKTELRGCSPSGLLCYVIRCSDC